MQLLVVDGPEVAALLPMRDCIEAMADALTALARGEVVLPLRPVLRIPETPNAFALMPVYASRPPMLACKVITVFPGNEGTGVDSHQGAVLLFEAERGSPLAVIDAAAITAIRTAAVSGLATRLLAREGAHDLAILGSGVQARTHLEAMLAVRPLRRVRAWSKTPERLRQFVDWAAERARCRVEAMPTARDAVDGADIVCTTTAAREPVLQGAWLAPGAHVNAVGSSVAATRELDTEAVRRASLYVDRRESALAEAGDVLIPMREGAITDAHIRGELGDVLLGRVPGRAAGAAGAAEVTLFKSLGIAVEDLAAARLVRERALARGAGRSVPFGTAREGAPS